jgi:hypothetical protein
VSFADTNVMIKVALFASLALLSFASRALASDFFVVTDTFKSQQDAQDRAALVGGWVLDTDAYSGLASNLFVVVRGPYATRRIADQQLNELKRIKTYKGAYVKEAGAVRIPPGLGNSVSPKVLAALLGELSVVVTDRPGATNPCEPQEPYQEVAVSVVTLDRTIDPKTDADGFKARRVNLDIGGFRVLKRTGEVERVRICAE